QLFTVANNDDLTVAGKLSTAAGTTTGLTKDGAGTLILGGDNSGFTGAITIGAGIAIITNANALGDYSTASLDAARAHGTTVADGAQLQVQGIDGTIPEHLRLSGSGILFKGVLLHKSGTAVWSGDVELDGDTTFRSADSSGGSPTITGLISDLGGGHNVVKEGVGQIGFGHYNTYRGTTTINNGILEIRSGSTTVLLNGVLTKVSALGVAD